MHYLRTPSPFEILQDNSQAVNLADVCRLKTEFVTAGADCEKRD